MANEQGLLKQTVFAKQSQLGPAYPTTGGKIKRRTSSVFTKNVDTYESNEIVSHQQSTGANYGVVKTSGKLDALLSPGTFSEQFESLLRKQAAATAPITTNLAIAAPGGGNFTVTRGSGSYLTDGVKIGDIVRLSGGTPALNAANSGKNLLVTAMTATALTVRPLNGVAMIAESGITGASVTVPGKKIWTPVSGHTNDYWTVEECYTGLGKFEQFTDCKIAKADLTLPATGNVTVSFDVPGLGRTRSTTATVVSPASETVTNVLTAVGGVVLVNGLAQPVTGAQFSIDGHIQPGEAEVGTNSIGDLIRGEISVSGQFTAKFSGTTLQDLYDAGTVFRLLLSVADGSGAAADFIAFTMSACKIFGDAPDDGEAKEIVRTYPFTAQFNGAGGATLADLQTIISIQDSQAV